MPHKVALWLYSRCCEVGEKPSPRKESCKPFTSSQHCFYHIALLIRYHLAISFRYFFFCCLASEQALATSAKHKLCMRHHDTELLSTPTGGTQNIFGRYKIIFNENIPKPLEKRPIPSSRMSTTDAEQAGILTLSTSWWHR